MCFIRQASHTLDADVDDDDDDHHHHHDETTALWIHYYQTTQGTVNSSLLLLGNAGPFPGSCRMRVHEKKIGRRSSALATRTAHFDGGGVGQLRPGFNLPPNPWFHIRRHDQGPRIDGYQVDDNHRVPAAFLSHSLLICISIVIPR